MKIALVHPDGCEVHIILPAPAPTVAAALDALGNLGFELDDDAAKVGAPRELA